MDLSLRPLDGPVAFPVEGRQGWGGNLADSETFLYALDSVQCTRILALISGWDLESIETSSVSSMGNMMRRETQEQDDQSLR